MHPLNYLPHLLLTSLITLSGSALALDSDRQQPISLEADSAVMDEAKGHYVYKGNVVVTQGSMIISAASVEILMNDSDNIDSFHAIGSDTAQAHLQQTTESDKSQLDAWADDLVYAVAKDIIILTGNAILNQHGNEFSGDTIQYSIADEKVKASAKPGSKQRVKMIFNPSN
ncbi:MAG: lipopolysaccharide transport periplasmic protein LptA [Gammaproteobacteria bacterium]|jgi:lipopolysaccharide export system protein LptA|nr:lipopolysaccharide transport periplasmic protein LptA [Gammaproteobacteria bacterium]MDP6165171.1 lipopolysaccharide transport periplasmic protein LptA [Gammaproteobacteria bacterium]